MVKIAPPPPINTPSPIFYELPVKSYEQKSIYSEVDGIIYHNAHNDEKAIALYERAENALFCPPEQVIRLDAPELTVGIEEVALNNNLIIPRYTK